MLLGRFFLTYITWQCGSDQPTIFISVFRDGTLLFSDTDSEWVLLLRNEIFHLMSPFSIRPIVNKSLLCRGETKPKYLDQI